MHHENLINGYLNLATNDKDPDVFPSIRLR